MALPYQCTSTLERMHVLVTEGSIKTCPRLVRLNLEDNMIDDEGKDQIRRRWDAVHVPEGLVL